MTDQVGKPVEAELSLALVNEALFAVFPDSLTPILDFFQKDARRFAEFHTGATCGFRYDGTTRPVAKAMTDEKERLARAELEGQLLNAAAEQMDMAFARPTNGPVDSLRGMRRSGVAPMIVDESTEQRQLGGVAQALGVISNGVRYQKDSDSRN